MIQIMPMLESSLKSHLERRFLSNIQEGIWRPNERIPTEEQLIEEYGASRSTIRRAMKQLEDNGLIEAIQGMGRRVRSGPGASPRTIGMLARGSVLDEGIGQRYFLACHSAVKAAGSNLATFSITESPLGTMSMGPIDMTKINGLVLMAQHLNPDNMKEFTRFLPLVVLGHDAASLDIPSFFVDYGAHTAMATRFLLERGHERILLTYGQKDYYYITGASICRGYRWMMYSHGRKATDDLIVPASLDPAGPGAQELLRAVEGTSRPPTAIISYSPNLASAVHTMIRDGRARFQNLEFVCLNDPVGEKIPGGFYFRCPFDEIAAHAMETLTAMMDGHNLPQQKAHGHTGILVDGNSQPVAFPQTA